MATFEQLSKDDLHRELGSNDTQVLFTGARRRHAINEGLRQFADLTECYIRRSTIACSSGSQEFNLTSTSVIPDGDFIRIASEQPFFEISDSNGVRQTLSGALFPQVSIPFLDHADQGWRSTVLSYPTGWYHRSSGGAMYLGLDHPLYLSTGSTETACLTVPYVAQPSSMTSSGTEPFTLNGQTRSDLRPYHQALVHYAAHDLEKLRKDKEASDGQLKKFLGYVERYVTATRPKGNRTVRTAVAYFRRARR